MDKKRLKNMLYYLKKLFNLLIGYFLLQFIPYEMIMGYYETMPLIIEELFIISNVFFSIHAIFLYYSLIRTFNIYDIREAQKYNESSCDGSLISDTKYFIHKKSFIFKLVLFFLFLFLLPENFGIAPFTNLVFGKNIYGIGKIIFLLMLLPLYTFIGLLAKHSAAKEYDKIIELPKKQRQRKEIYLSIVLSATYLGGGIAIGYIIPSVIAYVPIIKQAATSGFAIAIYILLAIIIINIYIIGIFKRKNTLKKIKNTSKGVGYRMSEVRFPIKSLFATVEGESFNLRSKEKTYSCKLISGFKKNTAIIFSDNGEGYYLKKIKIFRIELGEQITRFTYDYKADGYKILIINPVPKRIFKQVNGHLYPIDNGDTVGKYKIFSANSFLNALERNCIER